MNPLEPEAGPSRRGGETAQPGMGAGFQALAPLIQHHIVNSLGWSSLRPVQEEAIAPILRGENLVLLAGTAGGKTEAAFFPLLSRLAETSAQGLSILYLSPIRALLNNQAPRLQQYFQWVGRRAEVWHGDTPESRRQKVRRMPPDCLMTTPESLEALLLSTRLDSKAFFADLRTVVIDEVHAFAADDRGWHLLAVLERLSSLAGRDLQRLGLSATVGNREGLVSWLAGSSARGRRTVEAGVSSLPPQVTLDHVGSLENAGLVISRLHRGEKRLVFCDSRLQAELLATELRAQEVKTHVIHSALSREAREGAERAFREERDCVIVATSALELGIDVGDLDRVIQIDAPSRVASFLQRMGRTGRRAGQASNCLFLATDEGALLRAAGLIQLWKSGFVEDAVGPRMPLHVLAQQALAVVLQERVLSWEVLEARVQATAARLEVDEGLALQLLQELSQAGWLSREGGRVWIGPRAEGELGRRHYLALLSVFTTPPLFKVLLGQKELGQVHAWSFVPGREVVLVLAGRGWAVTHVDWSRRQAHVKPVEARGRSRWLGAGPAQSQALCEAERQVLLGEGAGEEHWSKRARASLEKMRAAFGWLEGGVNQVVEGEAGELEAWTFAGTQGNRLLAAALGARAGVKVSYDGLSLRWKPAGGGGLEEGLREVRELPLEAPGVSDEVLGEVEAAKFSSCLSMALQRMLLTARFGDEGAYRQVVGRAWKGLRVVA